MGGQVCDSFPHPGLSGRAASRDCQLDHSQASWADSESPEGRERQARREAGLMGEPSASVSQGLSPEHDIGAFPPKGCVQPHPPAPALLATVTSDLGLTPACMSSGLVCPRLTHPASRCSRQVPPAAPSGSGLVRPLSGQKCRWPEGSVGLWRRGWAAPRVSCWVPSPSVPPSLDRAWMAATSAASGSSVLPSHPSVHLWAAAAPSGGCPPWCLPGRVQGCFLGRG